MIRLMKSEKILLLIVNLNAMTPTVVTCRSESLVIIALSVPDCPNERVLAQDYLTL